MSSYWKSRSNVSLLEQFNRRSYILNKNDRVISDVFRILYNGTQSYYILRLGCHRVRRIFAGCYTIEMDNIPVSFIHYDELRRTGNMAMTITENPHNSNRTTTIYSALQIDMRRFMFQIFAIEQTKKRLVAQINAMPPGSSKLPTPDAYAFTVDIPEGLNDKEFELTLILCVIIDDMREYTSEETDDKEDFYDTN